MSKDRVSVKTRKLEPLHMRAAFTPGSFDAEKRTVEVIWSMAGARVLRSGIRATGWEPFYEELSLDPKHIRLDRLNNGAPLLNSHSSYDLRDVIGVVEKAEIAKGEAVATVRFSKREDVEPIFRDVEDGIVQNVSVGYRVHRFEQIESGDDGAVPVLRAIDWEPHELSFVPMGADDGAGTRSEKPAEFNDCEIIFRTVREEHKAMTDEEKRALEAQQAAAKKAAEEKAAADAKRAADEATAAERARVNGIDGALRAAKIDDAEFRKTLVDGGIALDAARAQILDKLAATDDATQTRGQHRVDGGEQENEKFLRGASHWLMSKAGGNVAASVAKHSGEKIEPGEFRGLSLLDLAREALERQGVKVRGLDKMSLVGRAFTHRSVTQSTSDFSVLLENTMHKILLASYATTADTWSRFCARGQVSDFRAHNRYRLGSFGRLDSVAENGEFKNKSIPDAVKELISAGTKGNIINLSRQAVINDDMGAFNRLAVMYGRAARLSVEMDVYDLLALNSGLGPNLQDGNPVFHNRGTGSKRNNISTSAAISVAGIDADRVVMASMRDHTENEILDLRPAVLLVPISLGGEARVINDAQYDPDTANKLQRPNKVRGLFRDVVDTARLTGNRRYLFADPNVAPVIEVAFLDGNETPFLESQDGWRVDGTEWKVRLDYGVAGVGYEGAVTNAGG